MERMLDFGRLQTTKTAYIPYLILYAKKAMRGHCGVCLHRTQIQQRHQHCTDTSRMIEDGE